MRRWAETTAVSVVRQTSTAEMASPVWMVFAPFRRPPTTAPHWIPPITRACRQPMAPKVFISTCVQKTTIAIWRQLVTTSIAIGALVMRIAQCVMDRQDDVSNVPPMLNVSSYTVCLATSAGTASVVCLDHGDKTVDGLVSQCPRGPLFRNRAPCFDPKSNPRYDQNESRLLEMMR